MTASPRPGPGALARGIATFLCVLFLLTLPVALAIHNLSIVVSSPERVVMALETSLVDGGALKLAAVEAFAQGDDTSQEGFSLRQALAYLSPAQKATLGELLFPDEWVRAQIRLNVEQFYRWLEQGGSPPTFVVDLGARKGDWLSGDVNQIVTTVMESWPACTAEMVGRILGATLSGNLDNLAICRPGDPMEDLLASIVATGFKMALNEAPDRLVVADLAGQIGEERLENGREGWNWISKLAKWSWWLPVGMMLLVGLLVVRDGRSLRVWFGRPLLLSGLLAFLLILAGAVLGPAAWRVFLPGEGIVSLFGKTLEALGRQAGRMQAQQAAGLVLVGLGLLLFEWIDQRTARGARPSSRDADQGSRGKPTGMFG
jgi:hypothetical protein